MDAILIPLFIAEVCVTLHPVFPHVAVVIPCGPGEVNAVRLAVLLHALFLVEPFAPLIVVVDDEPERERPINNVVPAHLLNRVSIIHNPRSSDSPASMGGLFRGVVAGLRQAVFLLPDAQAIVKMDTDALPINGFFLPTLALLRELSDRVAILGTIGPTCNRSHVHHRCFTTSAAQLRAACEREGSKESHSLSDYVSKSQGHGHDPSFYCQGGCYAVRASFITGALQNGLEACAEAWQTSGVGEDVLLSLYATAGGSQLHDASSIYASQARGLPFSPTELKSSTCGVVHSILNDPLPESEIVRYFHPELAEIVRASQHASQTICV